MKIRAILPTGPKFVRCGDVVIDTTKVSDNTVFKGQPPVYHLRNRKVDEEGSTEKVGRNTVPPRIDYMA